MTVQYLLVLLCFCFLEHIKPPVINFSFILCGKRIHYCILLLVARVVTCGKTEGNVV